MSTSRQSDPVHILVVDDDESLRRVISWALTDEGYSVAEAAGVDEALAAAAVRAPAVVVLDFGLADGDGASVARGLRELADASAPPIVLMTADGRASEKAERTGAVAYLHKPFDVGQLVEAVHRARS